MRVDKFLALQGLGSRSQLRQVLRAGRVQVDGIPARDGAMSIDPQAAHVTLDGEALPYRASLHIMLHKPAGYITAAEDPRHKTVMDLLPAYAAAMDCMPIGRLDIDTEGLLLLTTDGTLAHRLLSPKFHVDKVYFVQADAPFHAADADAFAQGIQLSDFTALPASLAIQPDAYTALVTVQEGKFHQIKRMVAARGKHVVYLKRLSFGCVTLDAALQAGQWRPLAGAEVDGLYRITGGTSHG